MPAWSRCAGQAEKNAGEGVFAKTPSPAPSAKNSYMAGGTTNVDLGRMPARLAAGGTGILPVIIGSGRRIFGQIPDEHSQGIGEILVRFGISLPKE